MKKFILLLLTGLMIFMIGCSNSDSKNESEVEVVSSEKLDENIKSEGNTEVAPEENEIEIVDSNENDTIENESNPIEEGKIISPLTGTYIDEEQLNPRPIAVMIDNLIRARPQAGLSEADVIYEILAEGNITRYLAIIYTNRPETIGPIRSARPYFIDKALEYDPLYVHVGGSPQAFKDVKTLKMADIDATKSGSNIFWRKNHKPKPNNMYSSYNAITKESKRRKYKEIGDFDTLTFNKKDMDIEGNAINGVKFPYRDNYISEFRYNDKEKLYYRYVNGKAHKDEVSKKHLNAKNIIVQYANNKVIDSKGRLEIDLIGEGKGIYITNGKSKEIVWKKNNRRDLTRLYDLEGNEISLNPGITWYQVVPKSMNIVKN